jgi:hypothetical protein
MIMVNPRFNILHHDVQLNVRKHSIETQVLIVFPIGLYRLRYSIRNLKDFSRLK